MKKRDDSRAAVFHLDGGDNPYQIQGLQAYLDDNIQRLITRQPQPWLLVGLFETDQAAVEACEALKVSLDSSRIAREYIQRTEQDRRKGGDRRQENR